MSPSSPSLFPQPHVYPPLSGSCYDCPPRRSFVFNGLRILKLSCGFFLRSDRLFSIACALFDKNTGGLGGASSRLFRIAGGFACSGRLDPFPSVHSVSQWQIQSLRPSVIMRCAQFWCNINTFRINTCKSVSKQMTLSGFRINTCEKAGGRGL